MQYKLLYKLVSCHGKIQILKITEVEWLASVNAARCTLILVRCWLSCQCAEVDFTAKVTIWKKTPVKYLKHLLK